MIGRPLATHGGKRQSHDGQLRHLAERAENRRSASTGVDGIPIINSIAALWTLSREGRTLVFGLRARRRRIMKKQARNEQCQFLRVSHVMTEERTQEKHGKLRAIDCSIL